MFRKQILIVYLFCFITPAFSQKAFDINSPSNKIQVSVTLSDSIYYRITVSGSEVISQSAIALVTDKQTLGVRPSLARKSNRAVNDTITNLVPHKRKRIPDVYNELELQFKNNFALSFRAYNDGVAYRWTTSYKDSLIIKAEVANFNFVKADTAFIPLVVKREDSDIFHSSFEEHYVKNTLAGFSRQQIGFSPVLVHGNVNVVITESDIRNYPGMFLGGTGRNSLRGVFAGYPAEERVQGGEFKQWVVTKRHDHISRSKGSRTFPWRVIAIAENDKDLLMNDLVYRLASPPKEKDWSWVKPGMSTEEWTMGNNIYGVDFASGLNTETYKYYVDFAAKFGLEYVMLDAGWSSADDLFKITPTMDIQAIADYAKSKNVGLMMWTLSMTLDRQLEEALTMFNKLGVKCIMTDFMDRDDQKTMEFYHRIAEATTRHKIMIMFHGAFKNAGFERTYPHAVAREGVLGSEWNMWSEKATPEHNLQIPFIRMIAGHMDYQPGFLTNVNKRTFRAVADKIMSQGTRCQQLAMFVAYESPLQVFAGNPSDALREPEYTTFFASLPTVWDESAALDGKVGDYLVVARRSGKDWYIAAMSDWTARTIEVDLSFLPEGSFNATIVKDGVNANQHGSDYRIVKEDNVTKKTKLKISMAPGGGYVAKLQPQ
jgi:alpha-glucosidase